MEVVAPFAAALLSFRLAGALRERHQVAWAAALAAYGFAAAALAWGAADGWDGRGFRVYYLSGGLLTAPLLGVGSLLLVNRRWAAPLGVAYSGFAVGLAVAMPVHGHFGPGIPAAQLHVDWLPRIVAILANSAGTLAVVVVAFATFAHRRLGNALIVSGVAVAGVGSGLAGLGVARESVFVLVAVCLVYLGVVGLPRRSSWLAAAARGGKPPAGSSG
jgi:hypothetical protein